MASAGLRAGTVDYVYPVYNEDNPAKGIQKWGNASVYANEIHSSNEVVTFFPGYYVVTGEDVLLAKGAICIGEVHIILADGAKLSSVAKDNFTPGIQVTGTGTSLTIYGQAAQTGQLYVEGRTGAAGIGGGNEQDGSNITINGGKITISGGVSGAGIGGGYKASGYNIIINGGDVYVEGGMESAGIGGGGNDGSGHDIIINGGKTTVYGGVDGGSGIGGGNSGIGRNITITNGVVKAIGGYEDGDGIGNGAGASGSSNIIIATRCIVRVGSDEYRIDVIENDGTDMASQLNGKGCVTTTDELSEAYNKGYLAGFEDGRADALSDLPTDAQDAAGHTVTITKGVKKLKLVNPDKVEFGKE